MKSVLFKLGLIILLGLVVIGCGAGDGGNKLQKVDSNNQKVIPPTPHKIDDEEHKDCLSCHKDGNNKAKKTKHPDRPNCTQCHKA
jgi:hypothetical protein